VKKATLALTAVMLVGSFSHAFEGDEWKGLERALFTLAVTFSPTTIPMMTTDYSKELSGKKKLIVEAREDITYFVASKGAVRTVNFNNAMNAVRELTGDQQSQDMYLAETILPEL
jgi:uncharacterized protein (TIGR02448 family)